MIRRAIAITLTVLLSAAACDLQGRSGGATAMLPDVPNTDRIEGTAISDYISSLGEGAALLHANPVLAVAIERAQGVLDCYQRIGAVAIRVYSDKSNPLSTGLVAIVDRTALTDPANFARCLVGDQAEAGVQDVVSICANYYFLKKEEAEFDIAYVATSQALCDAFCSRLEGCTPP